jgi:hypothetical protein
MIILSFFKGKYTTKHFKVYPTLSGKYVSPWHDVPLVASSGMANLDYEINSEQYGLMRV